MIIFITLIEESEDNTFKRGFSIEPEAVDNLTKDILWNRIEEAKNNLMLDIKDDLAHTKPKL